MVTGIVSANSEKPSFSEVMSELFEISRKEAKISETDGSNLPQVHALNSLKDILKSSYITYMGNQSDKYISQYLELVASSMKSEVYVLIYVYIGEVANRCRHH
jgi:predicted CopG family antitoxin